MTPHCRPRRLPMPCAVRFVLEQGGLCLRSGQQRRNICRGRVPAATTDRLSIDCLCALCAAMRVAFLAIGSGGHVVFRFSCVSAGSGAFSAASLLRVDVGAAAATSICRLAAYQTRRHMGHLCAFQQAMRFLPAVAVGHPRRLPRCQACLPLAPKRYVIEALVIEAMFFWVVSSEQT